MSVDDIPAQPAGLAAPVADPQKPRSSDQAEAPSLEAKPATDSSAPSSGASKLEIKKLNYFQLYRCVCGAGVAGCTWGRVCAHSFAR